MLTENEFVKHIMSLDIADKIAVVKHEQSLRALVDRKEKALEMFSKMLEGERHTTKTQSDGIISLEKENAELKQKKPIDLDGSWVFSTPKTIADFERVATAAKEMADLSPSMLYIPSHKKKYFVRARNKVNKALAELENPE